MRVGFPKRGREESGAGDEKKEPLLRLLEYVLDILAGLPGLRVLWTEEPAEGELETCRAGYAEAEIPPPLLSQTPLVMDPCCPLLNIADPDLFNAEELCGKAGAPDRLDCFRKLTAHRVPTHVAAQGEYQDAKDT